MPDQRLRHIDPSRHRGRPRKPRPPVLPLGHPVREYAERTSRSIPTIWRRMRAGKLRYVQGAPGTPRIIPISEYVAEGFCRSIEELADFLKISAQPDSQNIEGVNEEGRSASQDATDLVRGPP